MGSRTGADAGRGSALRASLGRSLGGGRRFGPFLTFGSFAFGRLDLGSGRLLDLDARRLDLGDNFVGVGQQWRLGRNRQVTDVDRRIEVDEALDRVLDRLGQMIR